MTSEKSFKVKVSAFDIERLEAGRYVVGIHLQFIIDHAAQVRGLNVEGKAYRVTFEEENNPDESSNPEMTPEFSRRWMKLSFWKREWVKVTAQQKGMTLSDVLNQIELPKERACREMLCGD